MAKTSNSKRRHILLGMGLALLAQFSGSAGDATTAAAPSKPKTAQDFANQYLNAFNNKDKAALTRLRYPAATKSMLQEMIDEITTAELEAGTKYDKFEILPMDAKHNTAQMGPDGAFYKPNLTPTNLLKLTSVTKNGSSSTTFPIGPKDGIFYQIAIVKAEGEAPKFSFGWQKFTPPKANWSVLMPNEPEPGRAALEKQYGKAFMEDADAYGVIKNTASVKTTQHWFQCGSEGKRVEDADNKERYRAACTTYSPESLKEWFNDPEKTLTDTISCRVASYSGGKLVNKSKIELAGSPGYKFKIASDDGTTVLGRVYWIKDALYDLTVERNKGTADDTATADKFLDSLAVESGQ